MKKLLIGLLALGSISAYSMECHRYSVIEKSYRSENFKNYSPTGVVENYLGLHFDNDKKMLPELISFKELNEQTQTEVSSVSGISFQGCETQVADLGNGDNWGSVLSLSSFKTIRGKVICTYFSPSDDGRFITCKL